jgi:hypothetical protein
MKKVLLLTVIVILCAGLLSACQITYPDSESDSYFEDTMELLSAGDIKGAKKLNGVIKGDIMEEQLQTAMECLAGRKVTQYKKTSSEITNRRSTGGAETRETASYEAILEDGTVLSIWTVYNDGLGVKGFSSFEPQVN